VIGIGAAIAAYAVMLTDWGFALSGTQLVARARDNPAAINRIIWEIMAAKGILGLLSASTTLIGACVFVRDPTVRAVLVVSMLNVIGSILTVDWALRGVEALSRFATASISGRLAAVPLVFLFVRHPGDVVQATVASAAGSVITASITLIMAQRLGILKRPSLAVNGVFRCLIDGANIFLSTTMISLYTTSLTPILSLICGTQQVGVYSAADKIRSPVQSLTSPISMVFYPRMNFLAASDEANAQKTSLNLLRIQGGVSFLLSAGLCFGAPFAVRILLGAGFERTIPVLRILAWLVFIINLSNVLGLMIMWPFGMKREINLCLMGGAIVGLILVVVLSFYEGAVGTATAAVISEAFVTISMYFCVRRRFNWFRPFARGLPVPDPRYASKNVFRHLFNGGE
jgi:O-antigen/teichoic acid export membrane protein